MTAFNREFAKTEFGKQNIARFEADGNPWSCTAVFSPYTTGRHVMFHEDFTHYKPDAQRIGIQEGREALLVASGMVEEMSKREGNTQLHFGFNNSPRSLVAGVQSVGTEHHYQVYEKREEDAPEDKPTVAREELGRDQYRAIIGHAFKEAATFHIVAPLVEQTGSAVVDMKKAEIGRNGLTVPVRAVSLAQALANPAMFPFIHDLSAGLDHASVAVMKAFTDYKPEQLDEMMRHAFEDVSGDEFKAVESDLENALKVPPSLLTKEQRTENIKGLLCQGFSEEAVRFLERINNRVGKKVGNGAKEQPLRAGFGYVFDLQEDLTLPQGDENRVTLVISPAISEDDKMGVVEARHTYLQRDTRPSTEDEIRARWPEVNRMKRVVERTAQQLKPGVAYSVAAGD